MKVILQIVSLLAFLSLHSHAKIDEQQIIPSQDTTPTYLALATMPGQNNRLQITRSLSQMVEREKQQETNTTQTPKPQVPTWITKPQQYNEYSTTAFIAYDPNKTAKAQKKVALALAKQSLQRLMSDKLGAVVQALHKYTPSMYHNELAQAKEQALIEINKDYIANLDYASSWLDRGTQKLYVFAHISLLDRLLFQQSIARSFIDAIKDRKVFYYYIYNEEKYIRESISDKMNVKLEQQSYSSKEAYEDRIDELKDEAEKELGKHKKYFTRLKSAVAKEF